MPTVIAIEAKPVEFEGIDSGFLHLYLVKTVTDDQGRVIVRRHVQRRIPPDFAQARDIAQHERTPGKAGFQHRKSKWLVARRQNKNRGAAKPLREPFRIQATQ